jgi:hypothetical protein
MSCVLLRNMGSARNGLTASHDLDSFFSQKRIILIYNWVNHQVTSILDYNKITTNYIQMLLFIFMVLTYHVFPHLNSKTI